MDEDGDDDDHIYIHTQNGILLSHRKEWRNAMDCKCNMDGPRDYHTKWSKSDRERQIPYEKSLTCGISDMTQMNQSTKQKTFTDIENRFVVAWGREGEGGLDWEFGISRCKVLPVK